MPTSRTIHLRRPPTIVMQDVPFVPKRPMLEIDQRWAAICEANPAHFDGRLCAVLGVHRNGHGGASIHVMDCEYRFHAVQDDAFDLGVRHLGVKGITSDGSRVLLGRRAPHVMAYGNMWEFAPGGVLEPGLQPHDAVQDELAEETGLACAQEPTPIALVYDPEVRCWEIVYRLAVTQAEPQPRTDEYAELRWCEPGDWPQPLSPPSRVIATLC